MLACAANICGLTEPCRRIRKALEGRRDLLNWILALWERLSKRPCRGSAQLTSSFIFDTNLGGNESPAQWPADRGLCRLLPSHICLKPQSSCRRCHIHIQALRAVTWDSLLKFKSKGPSVSQKYPVSILLASSHGQRVQPEQVRDRGSI